MNAVPFKLRLFIYCVGVLGIIFLSVGYYYISTTHAQSQNETLISVNSNYANHSYKYWAQKWWEWNLSFNKTSHPNSDYTESKCAYGQKPDSPVWFLVQPYPFPDAPEKFNRTCIIPHGKAIITPTQSGDCNYGDPEVNPARTDAGLVSCAQQGNDYTTVKYVKLDNKTYNDYQQGRRVLSDFFNANIIENNAMGHPNVGKFRAVVDGYYIFIKPLPPGEHKLQYYYETKPPQGAIKQAYGNIVKQNGTWNLIIK